MPREFLILDVVAAPVSAGPLHPGAARREEREFETVWDGTLGRQGKSLTGAVGMGSSLGDVTGFSVGRINS